MSKIIPASAGGAVAMPDYMKEHGLIGQELLKEYVIPPRLKCVQPSARAPFSELFSEGDLVAVPMMQLVSKFEKGKEKVAMYFAPIFFWPEWVCFNPLETVGQLKNVRERTFDKTSIIAVKARDERKRSSELCPEVSEKDGKKLYLNYVECLNFMIVPFNAGDVETIIAGLPVCLTFAKGEWRSGSNFSSLLQTRRAPIFGCQFQATMRKRENNKGKWYGLDIDNPSGDVSPWTSQESFEALKTLHEEYKAAYEAKALQVDYEDPEAEVAKDF